MGMRPTAALRLQATRILRSNAHPDPKAGKYLGSWGDFGSPTQKGIITYAMSANQQNPLAGTMHAAVSTSLAVPPIRFSTGSHPWWLHMWPCNGLQKETST